MPLQPAVGTATSPPTGSGAEGMARDAAWSYAALAATLASGLLVTALGFRALPEAEMGVYAIATATTSLLAVVDPAIGLSVSRNVSRHLAGRAADEERSSIDAAHAVLVALGLLALVTTPAVAAAAHATGVVELSAGTWWMLVLIGWSFAAQLATAALPAVLTGYSDFSSQAVGALILALVSLGVVVVGLPEAGAVALGAGSLVGLLVSRTYLWRRVRRTAPWLSLTPRRPTRAGFQALAGFTLPMLLLAISGQIIGWTDVVVVGGLAGTAAAALYRVGMLVPDTAGRVALPGLRRGVSAAERGGRPVATTGHGAADPRVLGDGRGVPGGPHRVSSGRRRDAHRRRRRSRADGPRPVRTRVGCQRAGSRSGAPGDRTRATAVS